MPSVETVKKHAVKIQHPQQRGVITVSFNASAFNTTLANRKRSYEALS
jgi:hypothetical protein